MPTPTVGRLCSHHRIALDGSHDTSCFDGAGHPVLGLMGIGEGFVSRLGAQGLLVYFVKAWGVVVSMVTRFRL